MWFFPTGAKVQQATGLRKKSFFEKSKEKFQWLLLTDPKLPPKIVFNTKQKGLFKLQCLPSVCTKKTLALKKGKKNVSLNKFIVISSYWHWQQACHSFAVDAGIASGICFRQSLLNDSIMSEPSRCRIHGLFLKDDTILIGDWDFLSRLIGLWPTFYCSSDFTQMFGYEMNIVVWKINFTQIFGMLRRRQSCQLLTLRGEYLNF